MSSRNFPGWYSIKHYQFSNKLSPHQWYEQLRIRRQSKALFDLIQTEPELFTRSFSSDAYWQEFTHALQNADTDETCKTDSDIDYSFNKQPTYIEYYLNYRILALFDLTHWYEIHQQDLPSNQELAEWLFPDVEKVTRYQINDAKKVLKKAMMECDCLIYWASS